MDTRHLEVQVFSRTTGKVVTTARCAITVINSATKKRMSIPVATMFGVKEGLADSHYGNDVSMPPGDYDVVVVVNGEQAVFHVTVPKM